MAKDKKNNTGIDNLGYGNSGDRNSGNWNSGDCNSGNCNSGNCNSGYSNSGYWNSGYRNSGDSNSGDRNSGYRNSGDRNSGYRNSGNWNSGNWNSGDRNSGYLCTDTPKVRIFNQETDLERNDIEFPDFFYFDLTEWVDEDDMTDEEKKENEHFYVEGGYLKTYDYQEAWQKAWDNADEEDRAKLFDLPNFDAEIFKEITGIDVNQDKENNKKKQELLDKANELIEKAEELKDQAGKL